MKKTAFIARATSGIGEATAYEFAKQGLNLELSGRRLEQLSDVHIFNFDVRDKNETFKAIASLQDSFKKIDILVNNTGNAYGLEPIQNGNIDDWDAMMDINVKGFKALQAKNIAETIHFAISRPAHVNMVDLLVFSIAQANSTTLKKSL